MKDVSLKGSYFYNLAKAECFTRVAYWDKQGLNSMGFKITVI